MSRDPLEIRIEILKYVYRLTDMTSNKYVKIFPDQIEGYFYNDMKQELQILKEKGLLDYTSSFLGRSFQIMMTEKGIKFVTDGYGILSLPEGQKKQALSNHLSALKI
ncbi:MAG: hypothetical protein ACOX4U_07450 [Anaerovoracaceae bacterium]